MEKLSFLFAALVAGMSFVSFGAGGVSLIDPSALNATSHSEYGSRTSKCAVNGAGLNADGSHDSDVANGKMWMSDKKPGWFMVDLAKECNLKEIKIWNFNWGNYRTRGIKNIEVYCSTAESPAGATTPGDEWTKIGDTYTVACASGSATYTGDDPIMFPSPVKTRWVLLVLKDNQGDGNYLGISEVQFFELAAPVSADAQVVRKESGAYEVSGTVGGMDATGVKAMAYLSDESEPIVTKIADAVAVGGEFTGELTGLASDKNYKVVLSLESAVGVGKSDLGIIYTGAPVFTKIVDAYEDGLLPGEVTVSRAEASPYPLAINYAFTSEDAEEGVDYEAPEGIIEIPTEETSATILLQPIENKAKTSDLTVTVSGEAGLYAPPEPVEVLIRNGGVPTDANVWIADGSHGNLASTAENWSKGVPTAGNAESLVILVNSLYGEADMIWDAGVNGLADTVTSWRQTANSTNTVTFLTTYPTYAGSSFKTFTVTGSVALDGGTWTHPVSVDRVGVAKIPTIDELRAAYTYRLSIKADSFSVGANGKINLVGKGHSQKYDGTNKTVVMVSAHASEWVGASSVAAYGNPKAPEDIGFAANSANANAEEQAAGGGALKLEVAGECTVNGEINVGGECPSNFRCAGAAGSVWIKAAAVGGTGTIRADGTYCGVSSSANPIRYDGACGRIAIETESALDLTKLMVSASPELSGVYKMPPGTVYLKDGSNPNGILRVCSRTITSDIGTHAQLSKVAEKWLTPVTEVEGDVDAWKFDKIVLHGTTRLQVGAGKVVKLPNGLASVEAEDNDSAVSIFEIKSSLCDFGEGDQILSGKWFFGVTAPLAFAGNLTVGEGSVLGVPPHSAIVDSSATALPVYDKCELTVTGDLTILEGGAIRATNCGFRKSKNDDEVGLLGYHSHGGRVQYFGDTKKMHYESYDSVFAPFLPGCSVPQPNGQSAGACGGVIKLSVGGELAMCGEIDVRGLPENTANQNASAGFGGSIDVSAKTISGDGKITADGGRLSNNVCGGGGRIAIKLSDGDFASFTGTITASGRVVNEAITPGKTPILHDRDGSAGTVYLQDASAVVNGGTIYIRNYVDKDDSYYSAASTNSTEMVSLGYGGDALADYKNVSYVVSDYGRAAVNANLDAKSVSVLDSNSKLDLNGNTLTVNAATLGDTKLEPGAYAASDYSDYLTDSVGGGLLVVKPAGLTLIYR